MLRGEDGTDPPGVLAVSKPLEHYDALARRMDERARHDPSAYRRRVRRIAVGAVAVPWLLVILCLAMITGGGALLLTGRPSFGAFVLIATGFTLGAVAVRSLFSRLPDPTGRRLDPTEAPVLFSEVEAVRLRLGAPMPEVVILDHSFNAGVHQTRRYGFTGRTVNTLILGLPLMDALSPHQFRAVLAHEYGHLRAGHSREAGLTIRALVAWQTLIPRLQKDGGWTARIFVKMGQRIVPHLSVCSAALRRSDEFEADAACVQLAGATIGASMLSALATRARFADRYWEGVWQRSVDASSPPTDVYSAFPNALRTHFYEDDARRWIGTALRERSTLTDSHPSLAERIHAFAGEPILEPAPTVSAAEHYLGGLRETLAAELDRQWHTEMADAWASRHAASVDQLKRLTEINAADSTPDQQHESALITSNLYGERATWPIYEAILRENPEDAAAHFHIGRGLLAEGEDTGIAWLERAMVLDPDAVEPGGALIAGYLRGLGDTQQAGRYLSEGETHGQSEAKRLRLGRGDPLLPHDLDPSQLTVLTDHLDTLELLSSAFLARTEAAAVAGPVYVLLLAPSRRNMVVMERVDALRRLAVSNWPSGLPGDWLVFVNHAATLRRGQFRAIRRLPGAAIFPALPAVPMDHLVEGFAGADPELGADGVGNGDQRDLHVLVERNTQDVGGLSLVEQVDGGPGGAQASGASGQHETPGGGQDRTEG